MSEQNEPIDYMHITIGDLAIATNALRRYMNEVDNPEHKEEIILTYSKFQRMFNEVHEKSESGHNEY